MEHFEYVVKPPVGDARIKRLKLCFLLLYFAAFAVPAGLTVLFVPVPLWPVMAVVTASILACVIVPTWTHTKPEYEYSVDDGFLTLAVIYSGRSRRTFLELSLRDAELIAPTDGRFDARLEEFDPVSTYFGVFNTSQITCFVLFKDENDEHCVLYLAADPDALKRIRRINPRTVV